MMVHRAGKTTGGSKGARYGNEPQLPEMATYAFRLFVSGMTPNSLRAIENIRAFCQQHLEGRYRLEIIDIYQQPLCAKENQIVAVPTLVKQTPPPTRRFIGDLSHTDRLLRGLGMPYLR